MFFDGEFRHIGHVDIAPVAASVAAIEPETWNVEGARQDTYKAHASTRTIPLIFDRDLRHTDPTCYPLFDALEPVLRPAMTTIRNYFQPALAAAGASADSGYFVRVILVNLAAGAEVLSHTDGGPSLSRAHRVHLPIITSDRALFAVAGNIRSLPPGELWEINNRKPHAVRNGGADRIHAIFDFVVPGEHVADPDGPLIA